MTKQSHYEKTLVRQSNNLRKLADKIERTIENSQVAESNISKIQSGILKEMQRIEDYINKMTDPIVG